MTQPSIFALTLPVFHRPFCLLDSHLPHPNSFFKSNTCVIGPYTSLSITMPKTFYYLRNIIVKTQSLPFASSITDLLNGMCPLGNISYFLLVLLLRLLSP